MVDSHTNHSKQFQRIKRGVACAVLVCFIN